MMSEGPNSDQSGDNQVAFEDDIRCPGCGYNLRGAVGARCPECGYDLLRMRSDACVVPWARRGEIGVLRAFWLTVWMAIFRVRLLSEAAARPVGYADARTFQLVVVLHALLPMAIVTTCLMIWPPTPPEERLLDPLAQLNAIVVPNGGSSFAEYVFRDPWMIALLVVCLVLFLGGATGAASYFFHPRAMSVRQQNNGIALSYYAASPVALAILPYAVAWWVIRYVVSDKEWLVGIQVATVAALLTVVACMWLTQVRLAGRIMPQLPARRWLMAVGLPPLVALLAAVTLVGVPAVVMLVAIVVASLM